MGWCAFEVGLWKANERIRNRNYAYSRCIHVFVSAPSVPESLACLPNVILRWGAKRIQDRWPPGRLWLEWLLPLGDRYSMINSPTCSCSGGAYQPQDLRWGSSICHCSGRFTFIHFRVRLHSLLGSSLDVFRCPSCSIWFYPHTLSPTLVG